MPLQSRRSSSCCSPFLRTSNARRWLIRREFKTINRFLSRWLSPPCMKRGFTRVESLLFSAVPLFHCEIGSYHSPKQESKNRFPGATLCVRPYGSTTMHVPRVSGRLPRRNPLHEYSLFFLILPTDRINGQNELFSGELGPLSHSGERSIFKFDHTTTDRKSSLRTTRPGV